MIKASCSGKMERGLKRASELLLEMCKFIKAKLTYLSLSRTNGILRRANETYDVL